MNDDQTKKVEKVEKAEKVEVKKTEDKKPSPSPEPNLPNPANKPNEPKKSVKVSAKLAKLIEEVEKLSVLELAELVKALEDKFGVSAAAPVAMTAANPAGGTAPAAGAPAEEKSSFDVILAAAGANKIAAIKAVRAVKSDLGLKEAKDLVEGAPKPVLEGVKKEEAENAKKLLTEAGCQVELK